MWSYSVSRVLKKNHLPPGLLSKHNATLCGGWGVVLEFNFSGIVFGKGPGLYHVRQLFFFYSASTHCTNKITQSELGGG